jgi:hypothetical protein
LTFRIENADAFKAAGVPTGKGEGESNLFIVISIARASNSSRVETVPVRNYIHFAVYIPIGKLPDYVDSARIAPREGMKSLSIYLRRDSAAVRHAVPVNSLGLRHPVSSLR